MYKVKCPECNKNREVKTKKNWMIGESPFSKICKQCSQIGKNKSEYSKAKISQSMIRDDTPRLEKFFSLYKEFRDRDTIQIECDETKCPRTETLDKASAARNIRRNGIFKCRECSYTEDGKAKIAEATSYPRSEETKKKMSEAKIAFFKTPKGIELKNKLSRLTAQGHAENRFENSKRTGWYLSEKIGDLVFYGSSYELRLCWDLDHDPTVETYETQIGYEIDGRGRCLDCLITYNDGNKKAVEVKPASRLNEQANIDQIKDSKSHAESQGWEFEVYTETNFGMTEKELRDWSDVIRSDMESFDWVEFRKSQNRKKANKHYKKEISQKKVQFFCEYCKVEHEVLEVTYKRNTKKNGRFICHNENAHKPKIRKKKINPYAVEGKKKCTKCGDIKLFENFGLDKSRSDGYASRCKECRK